GRSSVLNETDRSAPTSYSILPKTRQRPRPDAETYCGEFPCNPPAAGANALNKEMGRPPLANQWIFQSTLKTPSPGTNGALSCRHDGPRCKSASHQPFFYCRSISGLRKRRRLRTGL